MHSRRRRRGPGNVSNEGVDQSFIGLAPLYQGRQLIEGLKDKMDVVGAMLFLTSPLSDSMTGQTINVDGVLSWEEN